MADSGKGSGSRSGRRERREARLRDIRPDAEGNYAYTGDLWYMAAADGDAPDKRLRITLCAGLALLGATVIGSGFIDARSASATFYVVIPFIAEVAAFFALAWNAVRVVLPEKIRTYTLERSSEKIPVICVLLLFFAAAGLIFSGIYLAINGAGGKMPGSMAYLLLKAATMLTAGWFRTVYRSVRWEKA